MALVAGGTLNCKIYPDRIGIIVTNRTKPMKRTSSAANFNTAVKGVLSGTLSL